MKLKLFGAATVAAIVLAGCGGGGGGGSESSVVSGNFIDAPVAGVDYVSGDINGTTDDNGAYKCKAGSTISFSVAGVDLGTVDCGPLTTPLTLAGGDEEAATNIAYLLQNLDDDHNPDNGIHIKFDTHSPDWNHEPFHTDFKHGEEVDAVLNELGVSVTIDPEEAKQNMTKGINEWKDSHEDADEPGHSVGNPDNPPVSIPENPGSGDWQCISSVEYNGFVYTSKVKVSGDGITTKKENGYCFPVAVNGFEAAKAYEKETVDASNDYYNDRWKGTIEYWYPEGKVHYDITSTKYGHADCTAYFDVTDEHYVTIGSGEAYMSDYTSFDDKENMIDQGGCPDWLFEEDDTNDDQEHVTGTDMEHHEIKTKDGQNLTIDYFTQISKK